MSLSTCNFHSLCVICFLNLPQGVCENSIGVTHSQVLRHATPCRDSRFVCFIISFTLFIQERSEVIATYALCGFDNFGSVGMQLGTLTSIVPDRKRDFSGLAVRALIGGTLACYVTACTAGKYLTTSEFRDPPPREVKHSFSYKFSNSRACIYVLKMEILNLGIPIFCIKNCKNVEIPTFFCSKNNF